MEFIRSLPDKPQAKVLKDVDLLEQYGPALAGGHIKSIEGYRGLFELRSTFGSDAFRLFFFRVAEQHLVVVHGIRKKRERIAARDLETAEARRADYLRRNA